MSGQEHKTLGQVCFEEMWQAQHAATGASVLHWADVRPALRLWWESAAAAVKAAVLAEQEGLRGSDAKAGTKERALRVYNVVSATVYNMLTCVPFETQSMTHKEAEDMSRAVGAGVVEGLKAWEGGKA